MTIENVTAIVLAYVLVSIGVIIAFLLAAFVIGWFIGRLRPRRREQSGGPPITSTQAAGVFSQWT
jgi:biotin transporter BioY